MAYTTSYKHISAEVNLQPIDEVSTVKNHAFGKEVKAVDRGTNANGEGVFVYVKGVASGARGDWVGIDEDGTTTRAVADGYYPLVGIFMSDLDATTDYGWAQIQGKAVGKALTGYVDNALVYLTGTAGSVDDAAVAGDLVHRALGASALAGPEAGMAEFFLNRPSTDNDSDDNLGP